MISSNTPATTRSRSKYFKSILHIGIFLFALFIFFVHASSAFAAVKFSCSALNTAGNPGTWDTTTSKWSTLANCSSLTTYTAGDTPELQGTGGTLTVSGAMTAAAITFDTTGWTISGGTSVAPSAAGFTITLASGVSEIISSTIIHGSETSVTLTGSGSAVLTLSGPNTFTSTVSISSGLTLKLGAGSTVNTSSPTGTVGAITVTSGGSLDLGGFTYGTSHTQALTLNGSGVSSGGALQNSINSGGTFIGAITLGSAATILGSTGPVNITGTISLGAGLALTLDGTNTGNTITTVISQSSGSGTLTKQGTGTWKLSGASTYAGTTTISNGILQIGAASATSASSPTGAAGAITVSSGGTLDFNGFAYSSTHTQAVTINGAGYTGTAGAITNSTTTAVTEVTPITMGSAATIGTSNTGGLTLSGAITGTGNLTLNSTSTGVITLSNASTVAPVGTITNSGAGGATNVISGVIPVSSVTKVIENSTTSQLNLSGTNSAYVNGVTVQAGTFNCNNTNCAGTSASTVTIGDTTGSLAASFLVGTTGLTIPTPFVLQTGNTATLSIGSGNIAAATFSGGVTGTNNLTIVNGRSAAAGTIGFTTALVNNAGTVTNTSPAGSTGATTIGPSTGGIGGNVTQVIESSITSPLTVSGPVTTTSGINKTFTNSAASGTTAILTLSGGISGNGNITLNNTNSTITNGIQVTSAITSTGSVINSGSGSSGVLISGAIAVSTVTGVTQNSPTSALNFTTATNGWTTGLTIQSGTVTGTLANSFGANTNVITLGNSSGSANATLSGAGAVTFANPITVATGSSGNTLSITDTAAATFSGAITLNNTLTIAPAASNITFSSGGFTGGSPLILATSGVGTISISSTINNSNTVTNQGGGSGTTTISGVVSTNVTGVVENSTSSTLAFTTATNTWNNGLTIKAGTVTGTLANSFGANTNVITLGNSSGSANATLSGAGAVTFANPITVATGSSGNTLSITDTAASIFGGAVTLNNSLSIAPVGSNITFNGGFTGGSPLTLNNTGAGTITLQTGSVNNSNTVTHIGAGAGGTTIMGGVGSNVTTLIQNTSTSTLTISTNTASPQAVTITSGTLTNSIALSPSGALTISDGGTLTQGAAAITVGGTMTVGGGTSGTFTGSASALNLNGNLSLAVNSVWTKGAGTVTFGKGAAQTITDNATGCSTTATSCHELGPVATATASTAVSTTTNIEVTSLNVANSTTFDISNDTMSINGTGTPFTIPTPANLITTSSTVSYNNASATVTAATFNNLTLSCATACTLPASGTVTVNGNMLVDTGDTATMGAGAVTVVGDLTVTGTLSGAGAGTFTVNGNVLGAGTINLTGGLFNQNVAASKTFGASSGAIGWTFKNLTFSSTAGTPTIAVQAGTGTITSSGVTTIGASTTLDFSGSGARTIVLSGTGTPFVVTGTFGSSTTTLVQYTGNGATNVASTTYHDLSLLPPAATALTLGTATLQTMSVSGNMVVGDGSHAGASASTNNPTINVTGNFTNSTGSTFTSTSGVLTIGGNFSNSGTFTHNSGTVAFNTSATSTISSTASMAFSKFTVSAVGTAKTIKFQHAVTAVPIFTFASTVTLNGASGQVLTIDSDDSTNQWTATFNSAGSPTWVSVANSGCSAGQNMTVDTNSTLGANNGSCWQSAGIIISGTIKNSTGGAAFDCSAANLTIAVAVNGTLKGVTGSCTLSSGAYTISGVSSVVASNPIVVFISGSTNKGATYTKALSNLATISGLDIWVSNLIVRSEEASPNIANSDLNTYDSTQDATNLKFTADSNNLSVLTGQALTVWTGDTFTPAGTVTTTASSNSANPDGNLTIQSGATLAMGTNALSVGGDFTNSGTFTYGSGQVTTFTGTTTGFTIEDGTNNFDTLTINGSGGGWTLQSALTIPGALTITAGNLTVPGSLALSVGGATSITGTLTISSSAAQTFTGDVTVNASGTWNNSGNAAIGLAGNLTNNQTFTAGSGVYTMSGTTKTIAGTVSIPSLTISGTVTNNGTLTVATALAGSGTLTNGNSATLNVSGATPLSGGTLTASGTSNTVNYNSAGQTCKTITYVNLTVSGSGTFTCATTSITGNLAMTGTETWTTGAGLIVGGTTNIGDGTTLTLGAFTFETDGTMTVGGGSTGVFTATSGTGITLKGNLTLNAGATWTKMTSGTVTFNKAAAQTLTDSTTGQDLGVVSVATASTNLQLGSNAKLTSLNTAASTTFTPGANTLTILGSGSAGSRPFINGGVFTTGTSTIDYEGTSATDVETTNVTYNNLNVGTTSDVATGVTYTLNGNETMAGIIAVGNSGSTNSDTLTLGSTTLILSGTGSPLNITSKGTLSAGTSTVQYTGTTATLPSNNANFNNLTLGGTGTYSMGSQTSLTGNLLVTASAHVSSPTSWIFKSGGTQTLTGNLNNDDLGDIEVIANGTNSVLQLGSSVKVHSLFVPSSQTFTTNGANTITLTANDSIFSSGANQPLQVITGATFTASSGSTVEYTGSGATINIYCNNVSYANLMMDPATTVQYNLCTGASQTLNVTGNLTLGDGTHVLTTSAATNNPALNLGGNMTIAVNAVYTKGSGLTTFNKSGGGTQTLTDSTSGQDLGAVKISNSGTETLSLGSSVKATSVTVDASQTLAPSSNTLTLTGSGTGSGRPFVNNGVFTQGLSTIDYEGTSATDVETTNITYNNLNIGTTANATNVTFTPNSTPINVSGVLTIGASANTGVHTFDLTSKTLILTSTSLITPLSIGSQGAFTTTGSTVQYKGSGGLAAATTYNNLQIIPTSIAAVKMNSGTFTVNGDFLVGDGSHGGADGLTNNITLNVTGNVTVAAVATFTLGGNATTIGGDFTVNGGVSNTGSTPITIGGNFTGSGTVNYINNTITQRATSGKNFGPTGSNNWTLNNITFGNSNSGAVTPITMTTSSSGAGNITVTGTLGIGKSGDTSVTTLDAGNKTWTLSSATTPLTILGSPQGVLTGSSSTINFTGNGVTIPAQSTGSTYNNLGLMPNGSTVQVLSVGPYTIGGTLTVGDGSIGHTGASANTNNPAITVTGATTVAANATFTNGTGAWTFQGDLTVNGTISGNASQNVTANGNVSGSGLYQCVNATFEQRVAGNKTFGTSSSSNEWYFGTLIFSNSNTGGNPFTITTNAGTGNIDGYGTIQIGKGTDTSGSTTTLNAGSRVFQLGRTPSNVSGGWPIFSITSRGIFTPSTSTINYECTTGCSGTIPATTYYNLGIGTVSDVSNGITGTLAGAVTVGGLLTIGNTGSTNSDVLNLSSFTLTLSGTGTPLSITSKGTFTPATSTVQYTGTTATVTPTTFNNLTLGGTGTYTMPATAITVNGATIVSGSATTTTGAGAWTQTGDLTVNGTLSGSGAGAITVAGNVAGTGTINITGNTFEQRIGSAKNFGSTSTASNWTFNNLTFSNSATDTALTVTTNTGGTGFITIIGSLLIGKSGDDNTGTPSPTTLDAGNRNWYLGATSGTPLVILSSPQAVFNASSSTFDYYNGNTTLTATTYNNLTIESPGIIFPSADVTIRGNLNIDSFTGVTKSAANKIIFAKGGGGTQSFTTNNSGSGTGDDLGILEISANSGTTTLNLVGDIVATSIIVDASQTFNVGANNLTLYGTSPLTVNGTLSAASSYILFSPSSGPVTIPGNVTFGNVELAGNYTFRPTSGTLTMSNLTMTNSTPTLDLNTNDPTTTINGSLSSAGTILASNSSNLTLKGDYTNTGTFTHNNGTVILAPTPTTVTLNGGLTFYNLTDTTPANRVNVTAGQTMTIANQINFTGSSTGPIPLRSSSNGSQWFITLSSAINGVMNFVQLYDAGCSGGNNFSGTNDSLFNISNNGACWNFVSRGGGTAVGVTTAGSGSGGGSPTSGGGQNNTGNGNTEGGSGGGGGVLPQAFTASNGTSLTSYDSNWTNLGGSFAINTNAVVSNTASTDTMAKWTGGSYNSDQYAQMTISAFSSGSLGVGVRMQSGSQSGYGVYSNGVSTQLIRWDSGTPNVINTLSGLSAGDVLRLSIVGNTLTITRNGSQLGGTFNDSTYTSGRPGIVGNGNDTGTRGDDFYADSIASQGGGGGGGGGGSP